MTERERLIEILEDADDILYYETMADYILSKGVIVPPCKVGDTVYYVECEMICKGKIDKIEYNLYTEPHIWIEVEYRSPIVGTQITRGRIDLFWNKIVFSTREDAEKALKEREGNE